jgi:predicted Zn-dependent peptidase
MKKSPAFPFGAGSRLLLVVGLGLCLAAATPIVAGEPAFEPPPELGIVDFRLDNGLSVVVAVRPDLRLAAANLTVDFGSVDEPPGYSGMAHILEHVTLAGSRRIGSLDLEAELRALERLDRAFVAQRTARAAADTTREQAVALAREVALASEAVTAAGEKGEILGGRLEARGAIGLNATTSPDATQYFTRIPSEEVGYWLELEADRLRHPILRRFYSEQEVVLREIDTLTGGKPTAQERLLGEIFESAPVANPVAGRPDQIETFDRSMAFDFFHRYYRPENIAIAIVGDVDPDEVRELCERHFGSWQPTPVEETSPAARDGSADSAGLDEPFVRGYNSTRSPLVFLGFPSAEPGSVEEAAHLAIAALFASEELSPLQERFVRREPLVWSSGASPHYPSEKVDGLFLVHL